MGGPGPPPDLLGPLDRTSGHTVASPGGPNRPWTGERWRLSICWRAAASWSTAWGRAGGPLVEPMTEHPESQCAASASSGARDCRGQKPSIRTGNIPSVQDS
jgi:hypothetical protein